MKNALIIFLLFFSVNAICQQRVGFDINTQLISLNATIHYQKVVAGPLLVSIGAYGGGMGEGYNSNTRTLALSDIGIASAFPTIPNEINHYGEYRLQSTFTRGFGLGAILGIGLFREFKNFHGIRFNMNNRFGWMDSKVNAHYANIEQEKRYIKTFTKIWHPIYSLTTELYHTMRYNGRMTFYWGVKLPYSFSLDKGRFNPQRDSELFHKLRLELSLGLTRSIGKCD